MCEPGHPCPGAEEASDEGLMGLLGKKIGAKVTYVRGLRDRMLPYFGEDASRELAQMVHTTLKVNAAMVLATKPPQLDKEEPLGSLLNMLIGSSLAVRAQEAMSNDMMHLNMRVMRHVLDDFNIPDRDRLRGRDLLTECMAADESFTVEKGKSKDPEYYDNLWSDKGLCSILLQRYNFHEQEALLKAAEIAKQTPAAGSTSKPKASH